MGETASISAKYSEKLGERRQVSVLFADMEDYTAIVSKLGEELTLDFIRMVYSLLTEAVQQHGGVVRDFAGDSIMALFGIPEAVEDPALRACRAALAIHAGLDDAADEIEARFGLRPKMRIGVSSGNVLVATVQGQGSPTTAVGSTVNLASRIESLAPAGGSLICDTTRRLVEWVAELRFSGEHHLKGLAKSYKLWQLLEVQNGASRFQSSVAQGLSTYVGRIAELRQMSEALKQADGSLCVVDLVAEAGLGKTRLVFEFLQRTSPEDATVLTGHCFADGQHVPYLPILEVVRQAFHIREKADVTETERKLRTGLKGAGLDTEENVGLMMSLLGLEPPKGALDGLDGVLVGLRIRDLLPALLKALCGVRQVLLVIEDAHWIDSASEAILRGLVEGAEHKDFLMIQTRRPEYDPGWAATSALRRIELQPLAADDLGYLVQTRLGVDVVPDELVLKLTEDAGGNPLFGEEILEFFVDQGALRVVDGRAIFDSGAETSALPPSMQGLLSSRLQQLLPEDREVLQVASVIGRRFDPGLLSQVATPDDEIGAVLQRLQDQDVIFRAANSSDYAFKHVLMRDCVYQSLTLKHRATLHLAVAEALELRSANRLQEAAETLAFHYGHTDRNAKAFQFGALAGAKCLGVYSLDEAHRFFVTALELYQQDPNCATEAQFAEFLADFGLCSNISMRVAGLIDLVDSFQTVLDRVGDNCHHALFLHHYVSCLICNGQYREAFGVQQKLTGMADRLGDPVSKVYAMVNALSVSIYYAPITNDAFEDQRRDIEQALKYLDDAYIQNFFLATVGWNELTRGRVAGANDAADRMIAAGTAQHDPRSLGYGFAMKALIAMVTDDHERALKMAERARRDSRVEFEQAIAEAARVSALVPLEQPNALSTIQSHIQTCQDQGWALFTVGPETMLGVALAMDGQLAEGVGQIETVIRLRDRDGAKVAADWARLYLCELYLAVLSREGGGSFWTLLRNIRSIIRISLSGEKRVAALIEQVRENPQFDDDGHYVARCNMIMGLMCKAKKQERKARQYLSSARSVVQSSGNSPMLERIDHALAELAAA